MANMAYCRMENTYHDLLDCYEHILDMHPESSEQEYFFKLVALCKRIAAEIEDAKEIKKGGMYGLS